MTISPTQAVSSALNTSGSTSIVQAFGSANAAGHLLTAGFTWDSTGTGGTTVTSVTDTQGNTWQLAKLQNDTTNRQACALYYAENSKAGANTVTVTFPNAKDFTCLNVAEWPTGVTASSLTGTPAGASGAGTTATDNLSSGTTTPGQDNALIIGLLNRTDSQSGTASAGTGFTRDTEDATTAFLALEHRQQTTAAAIAATWTQSVSGRYSVIAAAFKTASSGGSVALATTPAAAAEAKATLSRARPLAAKATAAGEAKATLSRARGLRAVASAASGITAALSRAAGLLTRSPAAADAHGSLSAARTLAAAGTAAADAKATLSCARPLAAASGAAAESSATLQRTAGLAVTVAILENSSATLRASRPIAAVAPAAADMHADLTVEAEHEVALSGVCSAVGASAATLTMARPLSCSIPASAAVRAELAAARALVGVSAAAGDAHATLSGGTTYGVVGFSRALIDDQIKDEFGPMIQP